MNKNIAYLLESQLEQAEIVLAAKTITDSIQKMAEQAAKLEVEDVMPLGDPIRDHFGPEASAAFTKTVTEQVRGLVAALSDAKNAISDAIAHMQGEESDLASMDSVPDADSGMPADNDLASDIDLGGDEDFADDIDQEVVADDAEGDSDIDDLFPEEDTFADGGSNAAGRARKEGAEANAPVLENADMVVARQYAKMIREGKTAAYAASALNETYGVTVDDIVAILESVKK